MENENTTPNALAIDHTPMTKRRPRKPKSYVVLCVVFLLVIGCAGLAYYSYWARGASGPGSEAADVPLPKIVIPAGMLRRFTLDEALKVKGLYLTMDTFGTPSRLSNVLKFVKENKGINALVVDVKDNSGRIPCKPDRNIPSRHGSYGHFEGLVKALKRDGFYMIARIVAFQDPYAAQTVPEMAIRRSDGSLWRDRDGRLWLNPYDKKNWEFVRDIALWAQEMGFDEIQLDYVRFPDSAQGLEKSGVLMPGRESFQSRSDAIVAFLKYMKESLQGKAYLSADIFGFTTMAKDDMGIGQKIEDVASQVDFICPMVYPSHYYNAGIYGFAVPEAHPKEVVSLAMGEAIERTKGLMAKTRPWLQDFSMRIKYGQNEVQGQIDAVREHGVNTFLLWNPANVYTPGVDYESAANPPKGAGATP